LIDKRRPENSLNKDSFPSGHASAAFQGASFIQRRYGWKHGKYAYLLAAFVGYSRIEGLNDRHDTWDVQSVLPSELVAHIFSQHPSIRKI